MNTPKVNPLLLIFPPELAIIKTNIRPEGKAFGDGITRRSLADVILRMADPFSALDATIKTDADGNPTNDVEIAVNAANSADTGLIMRACRIVRKTYPSGKTEMELVPPALNRGDGAYYERTFSASGDLEPHGAKLWAELSHAVVARWVKERAAQVAADARADARKDDTHAGVTVSADQLQSLGIE